MSMSVDTFPAFYVHIYQYFFFFHLVYMYYYFFFIFIFAFTHILSTIYVPVYTCVILSPFERRKKNTRENVTYFTLKAE